MDNSIPLPRTLRTDFSEDFIVSMWWHNAHVMFNGEGCTTDVTALDAVFCAASI